MAASVEAAFLLLDRASPTLRKIRREADKTDRSLTHLGNRLDGIGTNQQLRNMDRTTQQIRGFGREGESTSRKIGQFGDNLDRAHKRSGNLTTSLAKLGGALYGLGKVVNIIKIPAMIAAFGNAVSAVGALGAGVAGLLPRLADMSGAAAAAIPTFAGLGLVMGTVKFAMKGVGEAMGGNKEALKKLTPEARAFVDVLKEMAPHTKVLRQTAQNALFPGLTRALTSVQQPRAMQTADRLVGRAGREAGSAADQWAKQLTNPRNLVDLEKIGNTGIKTFGRLSQAGQLVAQSLIHVGVAARPLTTWMGRMVVRGAEWLEKVTFINRQNGDMARFFDRTRVAMTSAGHILRNLGRFLVAVGRAARPLGNDLWPTLEKVTDRWADWARSASGQNWLLTFFRRAQPVLHEAGGLLSDIVKALFRVANNNMGVTANTLRGFRRMVPTLEKIVNDATRLVSPAIVDGIASLLKLFSHTSYLENVVKLLTGVVKALDWLMTHIPGATAILTAFLTYRIFRPAIKGVQELAAGWLGVTRTAQAATVAQAEAAATGAAAGTGVLGTVGGTARGAASGARGAASTAGGNFAAGIVGGAGIRGGLTAAGAGIRGGLGSLIRGGAGRLAGLGRFAGPTLGFGALLGALQGTGGQGAGGLAGNIASGATFGLIPGTEAKGAVTGRGYRAAIRAAMGGRANYNVNTGLARFGNPETGRARRMNLPGLGRDEAGQAMISPKTTEGQAIRAERQLTRAIKERQRQAAAAHGDARRGLQGEIRGLQALRAQYTLIGKSRSDQRYARDLRRIPGIMHETSVLFGREVRKFGGGRHAIAKAFSNQTNDMMGEFHGMGRRGRIAMGNNMLSWARQMKKKYPSLKGEYDRMERGIVASFKRSHQRIVIVNGRIYGSTKGAWTDIKNTMITRAEQSRVRTGEEFDKVYKRAIKGLTDMGLSGGQARAVIRTGGTDARTNEAMNATGSQGRSNIGKAGTGGALTGAIKALGGPIDSERLHDVHGMGPYRVGGAEWVLNRHTARKVNARLMQTGTSLRGEVASETRPNSHPLRDAEGGDMRRFAVSGGIGARPTATRQGGGINLKGANQSLLGYAVDAQRWGLHVSSGRRNTTTYHGTGDAIDVSAPMNAVGKRRMLGFGLHAAKVYGRGLEELIHTPMGFSIKNGRRVAPYAQADHYDHVHIADVNPGAVIGGVAAGAGGVGPTWKALKAGRVGMRGPAGAMGQRGLNAYTAMLNARGEKQAASMGGMGGGGVDGKGTMSEASIEALAKSVGMANPHLMAAIAMAESGGRVGIVNSIGATGLWQILWPVHKSRFPGMNPKNAHDNALMAKSILGSQGLGAWEAYTRGMHRRYMALGGQTRPDAGGPDWGGWFGGGGDFVAKRPTLIGVGDRKERVSITPTRGQAAAGAGGVGGGTPTHVTIGRIEIQNHRQGDIKAQVKAEVGAAFDELAASVDGPGGDLL